MIRKSVARKILKGLNAFAVLLMLLQPVGAPSVLRAIAADEPSAGAVSAPAPASDPAPAPKEEPKTEPAAPVAPKEAPAPAPAPEPASVSRVPTLVETPIPTDTAPADIIPTDATSTPTTNPTTDRQIAPASNAQPAGGASTPGAVTGAPVDAQASQAPTPKENGDLNTLVVDNVKAKSLDLNAIDPANVEKTAKLATDKADYAPTDTAIITGTGFIPGQTYTLVISSKDTPPVTKKVEVTADENGQFVYAYQLDGNYRPDYKVEVKNDLGSVVADATFTDSVSSATITSKQSGDWNTGSTWEGGVAPAATDTVIIASGHTVSTKGDRTCAGITVTGTLGMTNGDILTVNGDVSGSGALTLGNPSNISFAGAWTYAGTMSHDNRLNITVSGAGDQSMSGTLDKFKALTVNKGGGTFSINGAVTTNGGNFTMTAGTFNPNTNLVTIGGNLVISGGIIIVDATTWAGNYEETDNTPAAGSTIEYTNANPTINGAITYQNLAFSGTGTAGASDNLKIQGNLTNTGGGTLNFGARDVTLSGNVASNNIAGFTTTGLVSKTKTSGTATFLGNVNGGGLTVSGNGTLNLGAGLTHAFTGVISLAGGAGTLNGGSSTLNENAVSTSAWGGTGSVFSAGTGTVNFGAAGDQTISSSNPTFNNIAFSGSGIKTIHNSSTATIGGNLSVSGTAKAHIPNGANIGVSTLTLGGLGTINGTWGYGPSTPPTYKNTVYFSNTTGYLTVATNTRASQATLTVTGPASVTYGATGTITTSGGSGTGAMSYSHGLSIGCAVNTSTGVITVTNASGSCLVTATKATDGNYNEATSAGFSVALNKANSNVTTWPTAGSIVYGQTLASSALTGGASTPTGSFAFTAPSSMPNAGTASQSVTFTPTDTANYNSATGTVSVTVAKADATIDVTPYDVIYDSFVHTATATITGVLGEYLGGLDLSSTAHTDAGSYLTDSWLFTDVAGNYNNDAGAVNDNISKADTSTIVACPPDPQTYTGSAIEPCTVSVTGDGGLSLTPDPVYADNVNVGTVSASYTYAGDANHSGSSDSATFEISKATASVVLSDLNQTYDGMPKAATVTIDPVGLTVDITYDGSGTAPTNAASCAVVATVNDSNYEGSASDTLVVAKATLSAKADDKSKEAGTSDPPFTIAYSGFKFSDDASILDTAPTASVSGAHEAVGNYPIVVSGGSDNNYDFTYTDGTLAVVDTTAPATPTATPPAGDYATDQLVALSSSDSGSGLDSIYFTLDGTTPDKTKTLYTSEISINKDTTLKAIAYDKSGNASGALEAPYGIAPVISAETGSIVSRTSLTIIWTTDEPATSRVIYDTVSHPTLGAAPNYDYANSTVEDSTKVTAHSVVITGLKAGTTYYYRTVSHGSPESVSSEQVITTKKKAGNGGGGGGGNGGGNGGGGGNAGGGAATGVSTAAAAGTVAGETAPGGTATEGSVAGGQISSAQEQSKAGAEEKGQVLGEEQTKEEQGFLSRHKAFSTIIVLLVLAIIYFAFFRKKKSEFPEPPKDPTSQAPPSA